MPSTTTTTAAAAAPPHTPPPAAALPVANLRPTAVAPWCNASKLPLREHVRPLAAIGRWYSLPVASVTALMCSPDAGDGSIARLTQSGQLHWDQLHPNDVGHALHARVVPPHRRGEGLQPACEDVGPPGEADGHHPGDHLAHGRVERAARGGHARGGGSRRATQRAPQLSPSWGPAEKLKFCKLFCKYVYIYTY